MEKAQAITLDYLRCANSSESPSEASRRSSTRRLTIYIRTQAVRSLVFQIASNNDPYRIDPAMAVAVKAKASEEALAVTEACIQLHGAIGFADEHDIGLYLKRAMLLSSLLGNAAEQRRRYVKIAGLNA